MSTITKERIEQYANDPRMCNVNDEIRQIARIALASLEAEAVADVVVWSSPNEERTCDVRLRRHDINPGQLYAAPPMPVSVPEDLLHMAASAIEDLLDHCDPNTDYYSGVWADVPDKLRRAAMLQGADRPQNEPQNIPENIPATQFKPVADLYGLTSPTGGETSFTFDAVEARDFIDGGWSCQEYVELGRFQEAMLQNGNSPAQSDCCPEQNYIAPAQDGDSPVIPDGWVLVPEEPTHEMLEAGDEQFGTYDVYRRMIAASPQQK